MCLYSFCAEVACRQILVLAIFFWVDGVGILKKVFPIGVFYRGRDGRRLTPMPDTPTPYGLRLN